MATLTDRQREVRDFIEAHQLAGKPCPTHREMTRHFRFRSTRAVADHLEALVRKGAVVREAGRARSLRVVSPGRPPRQPVADIPLYGSIPAGFAEDRRQEASGCVSIDVATLGFKPTPRTFALETRGDSMIGKCILDGDIVVLEHGLTPRTGDVVAALIDNESTLKTFVVEKGKAYLRAENPKYPRLIPAQELVIQGVMVALVRRRK